MSYTIKCDDGDLIMDAAGRYVVVYGLEKVAQDIAESLLNNYDPEFATYYNGSELYKADANPMLVATIGAEDFIRSSVEESIERLQDLQDNDDYVDEEEKIDHIAQLTVDQIAPMSYTFYLRVITASEDEAPIEPFTVSLAQQLPEALSKTFSFFAPQGQDTDSKPYL